MTCCVTGHRPQGFPFPYSPSSPAFLRYRADLFAAVDALYREGVTHFITGMALGVDLDFAEAVLALKCEHPEILLEAAIPCPDQCKKWRKEDIERYERILASCNEKRVLSPFYTPHCMHARNQYMVNKADRVLGIWNGEKKGGTHATLLYAHQKGKRIQLLRLERYLT